MARIERPGRENRAHSNTEPSRTEILPSIPDDLLEHLECKFPDKLPPPGTDSAMIERLWGRREVVDYLKSVKAEVEQQNNVLKP